MVNCTSPYTWQQAWVDDSRTFHGLESVADAVEHMLSGTTSGKVVVSL